MAVERGELAVGEKVYKEICFACHGVAGDGKGPSWINTKPSPQVFADPGYMSRLTEEYMFNVIKYGKLAVLKRQIPKPMPTATAMPAFEASLTDEQIKALITFERAFLTRAPQSPETRELFARNCAICHGMGGQGNGVLASPVQPAPDRFVSLIQPPPVDYTDPLLMGRFQDDFLFWLIKKGRVGATEDKGYNTMQPFGQVLSDDEIWSVIAYIRKSFIDKRGETRP